MESNLPLADWAAEFKLLGATNLLYAWSVFHFHTHYGVLPPLPPVPPMVLQMLNVASVGVQWQLRLDAAGEVDSADTSCSDTVPRRTVSVASLLRPNWWRALEVRDGAALTWLAAATAPLRLRSLTVFGDAMFPQGFEDTVAFRVLQHVTLKKRAQMNVVAAVAALPRLTSLTLTDASVTNGDIASIAVTATALKTFAAARCGPFTSVSPFTASTSIEELDLQASSVATEGLAGVERIPTLRVLNLTMCRSVNSVSCLAESTSLADLNLNWSLTVASAGIHGLEGIPTLVKLDLSYCKYIKSVSSLAESTSLTELDLRASEVTSEGLKGLERIPSLTKLHLGFCKSVASISCLAASASLVELIAFGTSVTSAGLSGLERIPTLRTLDVRACESITPLSFLSASTSLEQLIVDLTSLSQEDHSDLKHVLLWAPRHEL